MPGYRALRESAAWVDISSRGRIRVAGEDRVQFVHAMCSNDVESLRPGQGVRAFFLDVKGHIQADARIFVSEDHVLIDCEPERPEQLREHLERFIVMDDVTLQRHSGVAVALEGPSSDKIAREVLSVTPPPAQPYSHVRQGGLSTIRASLTGQPGLWLLVEEGSKIDLAAKLGAAGVPAATANDVLTVRVENGVPLPLAPLLVKKPGSSIGRLGRRKRSRPIDEPGFFTNNGASGSVCHPKAGSGFARNGAYREWAARASPAGGRRHGKTEEQCACC